MTQHLTKKKTFECFPSWQNRPMPCKMLYFMSS